MSKIVLQHYWHNPEALGCPLGCRPPEESNRGRHAGLRRGDPPRRQPDRFPRHHAPHDPFRPAISL